MASASVAPGPVPVTDWRMMSRETIDQHLGHIRECDPIDEWVKLFSCAAGLRVGLHDTLRPQARLGRSFCELHSSIIYESGNAGVNPANNSNDCLIHSFLSCTSKSFRKLRDDLTRNVVASFFRRVWLWNMVKNRAIALRDDTLEILKSVEVLSESTGEALARYFGLNILWVQGAAALPTGGFGVPQATFVDNNSRATICIFGDNTHFQPVELVFKHETDSKPSPPNFILKDFEGEVWHAACFSDEEPRCDFQE